MHCGPRGYVKQTGQLFCETFHQDENQIVDRPSASLRFWYQNVRKCLQDKLQNVHPPMSCSAVDRLAFQSHVSCYQQTNFCSLSFQDQVRVVDVIAPQANNIPNIPASRTAIGQIVAMCGSYFTQKMKELKQKPIGRFSISDPNLFHATDIVFTLHQLNRTQSSFGVSSPTDPCTDINVTGICLKIPQMSLPAQILQVVPDNGTMPPFRVEKTLDALAK